MSFFVLFLDTNKLCGDLMHTRVLVCVIWKGDYTEYYIHKQHSDLTFIYTVPHCVVCKCSSRSSGVVVCKFLKVLC